ncbi:hypothetical protein IEQ34_025516 [Dendrobium chrysotoxum]|uniref:Uncharacterized protein n=1 Tax=Dendrobium chrysotoxum TaxID=161865 RepID=A0AAV7FP36_DENCH|nr:hypothetical protein IEQ34_025516 [Dendrobium chrysotoxum]
MPISDDGGSSSEIIRVLGGPSIGDLRSRLVRMIPTSTSLSRHHAASSIERRPSCFPVLPSSCRRTLA